MPQQLRRRLPRRPKLVAIPPAIDPGVCAALRDLLYQARRGEIIGFAIACVAGDGAIITAKHTHPNVNNATLIGAMARVQHRMMNEFDGE